MSQQKRFDVHLVKTMADGFVGRVNLREKFSYDAPDAFEALAIFMVVNRRQLAGKGTQVMFIAVTPGGQLPPAEMFSLLKS